MSYYHFALNVTKWSVTGKKHDTIVIDYCEIHLSLDKHIGKSNMAA